jgi:hypothetical protein
MTALYLREFFMFCVANEKFNYILYRITDMENGVMGEIFAFYD